MHPRRTIRSYVLRQGRLTPAQARALETLWPAFGIEYAAERLDLNRVFGRTAPKILDIGSGMGDSLIELAQRYPDNDYLAIEVHRPGVGNLIRTAAERGIGNIKVICRDVIDVLQYQLAGSCLDEVYVFFPDPWPKKRHHKRRLVNPLFLDLLKPALKRNARIFFATDWEELARHILYVCDNDSDLMNLAGAGNFTPRPAWRPVTKFEKRGRNLDLRAWDLCYSLL